MSTENNYSKWLVVSDIDGTLNDKRRKLVKKNLEAITEFTKSGGFFTLASSRNPQSMFRHYRNLPISTPGIVTNGAGIYDFTKKEYVHFTPISQEGVEEIIKLKKSHPTLDSIIVTKDNLYITGFGCWSIFYVLIDRLSHKYEPNIEKVPKENWGKVIVNGPWWRVSKVRKELENQHGKKYDLVKTSFVSFEILPKGVNKGTAVLKLAEILGIDKDHTAGIGDYYNDLKMLKKVGVSACCGQAPEKMKAIADYITCHCNEGAVADFIEYLKVNYIEELS